jgi:lysozyme
MLQASLVKYDEKMVACLHREIPDSMHIAFISATYNIGVYAFCHSSMARKVNDGDLRGACDALLAWDRAGGREIKGLHNRRVSERAICLKDLGG